MKILSLIALAISLAGCPQAAATVVPGAACVTSVIQDALQGMTLEQILLAAGPGCVQDIEDVITILLGSADPRLPSTAAYKQAQDRRAAK